MKTTHAQIALLQKALTSLGYDTQGADGKFGDHTLAAVKAFQQAKHLTVDGYFGKNSLAALELDMGGHLDPTPGGCIAAALDDDASTDSDTNTGSDTDDTAFVREAYDRQAALAYAAKWYAGNNPDFTWFGKSAQGQQSPVGGNGDCANFVSQCLYAGGMPMKWTGSARDRWYYEAIGGAYSAKSPSWAGAHELRRFIKYNTGSPRIAYEFLPSASGMVPGDLVFVLDRSQGEAKANAKAKHVAMVREVQGQTIYIYSHSPYNENGLRTKKNRMFYDSAIGTVRQQMTEYTLHGKNIVHWSSGTNTMHFFYDAQNRPAVVVHNGKPYGYLYNLQGDVIALIDSSGNRVVEYRYDAWGRILSKTGTMANTLGTINPFRYRGYVYDGETGLYYLRSRYYKPNWARFLNGDKQLALAGCSIVSNVFVYCMNSPINRVDTDGAKAEHFVKPNPIIGDILTTDAFYSVYEKFMQKYHEASKGKWWNVPHLERTNDCFGITNVEYSISTRHVSSARQIISDIVSHVGNLATLIGEGGGAYTISAAAAYMGCFIDPGVLSQAADYVSQACDAFGKVDDLYAIRDLGHDHEVHTLRIQRDAIKKTVHVFSFEVCSIGTCPTEMQYITLYGWQAN